MPTHFLVYKKEGQTPLEALENLRLEKGIDQKIPMTYAGRLDPMAEGFLLILIGEECKKKDLYLGLDKEYEVEVLLGISSDTGDILGILNKRDNTQNFSAEIIKEKKNLLIGKRSERYPRFSSKKVHGKLLFEHAREGVSESIDIPEKNIEIYSIEYIDKYEITDNELLNRVCERISRVNGDFRQNIVIDSWRSLIESGNEIKNNLPIFFQIIKLKVNCSSGAYMRTLAQKLGELLGTKALAWSIKRTKIGDMKSETKFL